MSTECAVRERPILFSGPMVRASLCDVNPKRMTRRTRGLDRINESPNAYAFAGWGPTGAALFRLNGSGAIAPITCPYGKPGDRLWVRETALYLPSAQGGDEVMYEDHEDYDICYPVKGERVDLGWRVRPSIFMPRWASRLTLEITDVRIERLNDISHADAKAEGVEYYRVPGSEIGDDINARSAFITLWDSLNAERGYSWDSNPWVWAITFPPTPAHA